MLAKLCLPALLALAAQAWAEVKIEAVAGQPMFTLQNAAIKDLSGITWAGGDLFYAVSDDASVLQPITLKINRATGQIASGEFRPALPVRTDVSDFEGIAYVSELKVVFISAEEGNAVISLSPATGTAHRQRIPPIFERARGNLGLESLTWNDTAQQFWIANEEALEPDGPLASANAGTLVRLQRLDPSFQPSGQFAWRTEPAGFRFQQAGSGVSDLCLLPGGELIVLERGFASGGLHLRLFLAGLEGATDVSRLPALAGAKFVPAKKTLLLDQPSGFINYEGVALGPPLEDGSRSLIVIADSNGGETHAFLPLKIRSSSPPRDAGTRAPDSHTERRDGRPDQPSHPQSRAR